MLPATVTGPDTDSDISDALPQGLEAEDWIVAGVTVVAFFVAAAVLRRVVTRLVGRIVQNLLRFVGIFYALGSLGVQVGPLFGALGISGLAIAIAATSILENFIASLVLKTRRPITRGDEVDTAGYSGVVEEINFRTVVLRTYDGQKVVVPSHTVNTEALVNRTSNGRRRSTVPVGVAYATNLREAERVLVGAVRDIEGVYESPAPDALVTAFGASSIDFDVRFWHDPDIATMLRVRSEAAMRIHEALGSAGIEIPFPQRVVTMVPDAAED